jgi:hypothetical protein
MFARSHHFSPEFSRQELAGLKDRQYLLLFIYNFFLFQGGNLNIEDDFESEYLRYGGTVGVRNPRLVAAMRGVPPYQQQHIQMNMLGRY